MQYVSFYGSWKDLSFCSAISKLTKLWLGCRRWWPSNGQRNTRRPIMLRRCRGTVSWYRLVEAEQLTTGNVRCPAAAVDDVPESSALYPGVVSWFLVLKSYSMFPYIDVQSGNWNKCDKTKESIVNIPKPHESHVPLVLWSTVVEDVPFHLQFWLKSNHPSSKNVDFDRFQL